MFVHILLGMHGTLKKIANKINPNEIYGDK